MLRTSMATTLSAHHQASEDADAQASSSRSSSVVSSVSSSRSVASSRSVTSSRSVASSRSVTSSRSVASSRSRASQRSAVTHLTTDDDQVTPSLLSLGQLKYIYERAHPPPEKPGVSWSHWRRERPPTKEQIEKLKDFDMMNHVGRKNSIVAWGPMPPLTCEQLRYAPGGDGFVKK